MFVAVLVCSVELLRAAQVLTTADITVTTSVFSYHGPLCPLSPTKGDTQTLLGFYCHYLYFRK